VFSSVKYLFDSISYLTSGEIVIFNMPVTKFQKLHFVTGSLTGEVGFEIVTRVYISLSSLIY